MALGGLFKTNDSGVFIREAQLLITPEQSTSSDVGQAVVIKSSGNYDELRMSFNIEKNICSTGMPNSLEVSVYNLSSATRQLLAKQATNIGLQLGYRDGLGGVIDVATGGIASVSSEREGADIKTTIFCYDGLAGIAESTANKSYKGGVLLKQVIQDLANEIKGVEVSELNIKVENNKVLGSKGRVLSGRTCTLLDKLAREFGFTWGVQLGVFKVVEDNFTEGNVYEISAKNGNLINATPVIDNINQLFVGIEITTVLDPRIQPADVVSLTSIINPVLNNSYQVTSVKHTGDTHAPVWQTLISCKLNEKTAIPASQNQGAQG